MWRCWKFVRMSARAIWLIWYMIDYCTIKRYVWTKAKKKTNLNLPNTIHKWTLSDPDGSRSIFARQQQLWGLQIIIKYKYYLCKHETKRGEINVNVAKRQQKCDKDDTNTKAITQMQKRYIYISKSKRNKNRRVCDFAAYGIEWKRAAKVPLQEVLCTHIHKFD